MDEYDNIGPQGYSTEIAGIMAALQESSGAENDYRNRALKAQMQSAEAARKNAMEIAQLQAKTTRYGIDVASRDRMAQLKENARQFDAQHGLAIAEAYTKFASTPDLMFARNDFVSAMNRAGQGQGLPQATITRSPGPQAKTYQDFAAIAQYNGSQVPGASSGGGGSSSGGGQQQGASAATADPRIGAANAIVKALPPSETAGQDDNDWAAIDAIKALYGASLPGTFEKLGAQRTKIAMAGMARAGYDPLQLHEDYLRTLPGQRSPLLA